MGPALRRLQAGEMPAEGDRGFNRPPLSRRLAANQPFVCLLLILAFLAMTAYLPVAASATICNEEQNLPLGPGSGEDLEVTGPCTVAEGQTYHYGNVNIYNGGSLKFVDPAPDKKIHFWAKSILVENKSELIAGEPNLPIGDKCQAASDRGESVYCGGLVTFHLYGADQGAFQIGTNSGKGGKGITCKTDVRCGVPEAKWNSNGSTKYNDLPGGVSDYFYAYGTLPYDDGDPNGYFGYKVLAVSYGGTLQLFGRKGATNDADRDPDPSYAGRSWVRLNKTSNPGDTTLVLNRKVDPDWEVGDQIVVTTTDYLPGHSEQLEICSVNPADNSVTVQTPGSTKACGTDTEAVKYIHNGAPYDLSATKHPSIERLNLDIKVEGKPAVETRAAVALLSRSIRIVSEGADFNQPLPTPSTSGTGKYFGGHTLVRQGFERYQVQGVEFFQLGQGGRMGHYPVHFHMVRKTPQTTFVKDCSVHDSMTRWITVHATQGVTLARNVGYKSIGHGYYLEDGTEINNKLYSNIGIFSRAAIANDQNPRRVPGILAWSGQQAVASVPYNSDNFNPSVFWIMNGWNDFQYNMAVGAGACGVCYWLLPGANSGMSQGEKWESYASMQSGPVFSGMMGQYENNLGRAGMTPLKSFRGNYCSTAMMSFNTVGATDACLGIDGLGPVANTLAPAPEGDRNKEMFYPKVDAGGGRFATRCDQTDCSAVPRCDKGNARAACMVTVLDRYTSAFHWPQQNFAAIWLRPQWYLFINSVLSDTQNGGLGFVTGGDYIQSSVVPGLWQLATKSVFIGNTQQDNPLASNAGPFNPLNVTRNGKKVGGLACDGAEANFCRSKEEGISIPLDNFAVNQRLYNIYDGPNYQDSNAYLDIKKTNLGPQCEPANCPQFGPWMYTRTVGIPRDPELNQCVLPNAAIGWKQPNGFYYPPAFHSMNLFFDNVDIRHYVLEPLWLPGTFDTNEAKVKTDYCRYNAAGTFNNFSSVDRQTVLNDDDGSLTGLVSSVRDETISVNLDPFFNAPIEAPECESFGTAKTSPYEYLSTVVYPDCAVTNSCSGVCDGVNAGKACTWKNECDGTCNAIVDSQKRCSNNTTAACTQDSDCASRCSALWGRPCTSTACYGVPLERQLLTSLDEGVESSTAIRMAGMDLFQRSMLTLNNATYYIDTTVSEKTQRLTAASLNVFEPGKTYYVFLLYAKPTTKQTYEIYVGKNAGDHYDTEAVEEVRADIGQVPIKFAVDTRLHWDRNYNKDTGILRVTIDLAPYEQEFTQAKADFCQPSSFCSGPTASAPTLPCNCNPALEKVLYDQCVKGNICGEFAGKDIDCPLGGCFGFKFTLPPANIFVADDDKEHRLAPKCFPKTAEWNVELLGATQDFAGSCFPPDTGTSQFCTDQSSSIPLNPTRVDDRPRLRRPAKRR